MPAYEAFSANEIAEAILAALPRELRRRRLYDISDSLAAEGRRIDELVFAINAGVKQVDFVIFTSVAKGDETSRPAGADKVRVCRRWTMSDGVVWSRVGHFNRTGHCLERLNARLVDERYARIESFVWTGLSEALARLE